MLTVEEPLTSYAHYWTTDKDDYAIFTIRSYGEIEYLILHLPSKRIKLARSFALERAIVRQMLEHGVRVLDDPPA
jgi:hypothetical protein